jgi:ribosomal protein S18 acetylase RimI-like enzyme
MEVRRYRAEDRDAIWDLHNVALHAVGAHAGDSVYDADLRDVEQAYLHSGGEFLVGTLDGRVVAMGALRPDPDHPRRAELKRMRVEPALQGRGLGRTLLDHLLRRARELGVRELTLDTTERQVAAMSLYRSVGFTETGRGVLHGFDVVFFRLEL